METGAVTEIPEEHLEAAEAGQIYEGRSKSPEEEEAEENYLLGIWECRALERTRPFPSSRVRIRIGQRVIIKTVQERSDG